MAYRAMGFRRTDRFVLEEVGIRPLSVASDRIAMPAMRCAWLLSELEVRDRSGDDRVFEVYPAAALTTWGLRSGKEPYKGRKGEAALAGLFERLQPAAPWLRFASDAAPTTFTNDHIFDALVSAMNARAAALRLTHRPPREPGRDREQGRMDCRSARRIACGSRSQAPAARPAREIRISLHSHARGPRSAHALCPDSTTALPRERSARLTGVLELSADATDGEVQNGQRYHYAVSAVDRSGNESSMSAPISATPNGGRGSDTFINELHYDNSGSDTDEFVEIAGPAGTDLSGWTIAAYNGANGAVYQTIALSGRIQDLSGCVGVLDFDATGLQNGNPDGLALIDPRGAVLDFISYGGSLSASGGPAAGRTAVDIGVQETGATPPGSSVARSGAGVRSVDFEWQGPSADTRGAINSGQSFDACAPSPGPFINELHYDNAGADADEGVEIAGPAGTDLSGWRLVLYNGNDGARYANVDLSGIIQNQSGGYGALWFAIAGLQNGASDAVALVDPQGAVLQLISYEGGLVAADGPAAGQRAVDIGVQETGSTPVGFSLQLEGAGAGSFTWAAPAPHSRGMINPGQSFGP